MRRTTTRLLGVLAATAITLGLVVPVQLGTAQPAAALTGSQFDPSLIVADANFYDGGAMTQAEIQAFLDAKIGTCTNGKCLNVIQATYAGHAADFNSGSTGAFVCKGLAAGTYSIAKLIYDRQVACGLSAKAILVTLQKEQGLVTATAPSDGRLKAAMGAACPDTGACDTAYAGVAAQIVQGSFLLAAYRVASSAYRHAGGSYWIGYSPSSTTNAAPAKGECGGTTIKIQNDATAALYNYTPYQPNAAALANLNGTGDSCSTYGNRNFWVYWWSWFGDPTSTANLVQSSDGTTYLVGQTTLYPFSKTAIQRLYAPLGSPQTVSNSFLKSYTVSKQAVGFAVRNASTGAFALYDGTLHAASSCAQLADFGLSCDSAVPITASQAALLPAGGALAAVAIDATTGSVYQIDGGKRTWLSGGVPKGSKSVTLASVFLDTVPSSPAKLAAGTLLKADDGKLYLVDSATVLVPVTADAVAGISKAKAISAPDDAVAAFPKRTGTLATTFTCGTTTYKATADGGVVDAGGAAGISLSAATCATLRLQSAPAAPIEVYRFWSSDFKEHFYTTSVSERDRIIATYPTHTWSYEGEAFQTYSAAGTGTVPIYRFWSPRLHSHFFTASESEKARLISQQADTWNYEGIAFYTFPATSSAPDTLPVYRFWSSAFGSHFYTTSESERARLVAQQADVWHYETVAFRVPAS